MNSCQVLQRKLAPPPCPSLPHHRCPQPLHVGRPPSTSCSGRHPEVTVIPFFHTPDPAPRKILMAHSLNHGQNPFLAPWLSQKQSPTCLSTWHLALLLPLTTSLPDHHFLSGPGLKIFKEASPLTPHSSSLLHTLIGPTVHVSERVSRMVK